METKKFHILSIEDNEPDFELLKKALNENCQGVELKFTHFIDGETAINFLFKKGEFSKAKTPNMVILDLNLPGISGLDILDKIKKSDELKHIPVIMFTTSESEKDINKAYKLYANSYITKTFTSTDLFRKIGIIGEYWLKTTEIPETDVCLVKIEEKQDNK